MKWLWNTETNLFSLARWQHKLEESEWRDKDTGHDEVEAVVERAPAYVQPVGEVYVRLRTAGILSDGTLDRNAWVATSPYLLG